MAYDPTYKDSYMDLDKIDLKEGKIRAIRSIMEMCEVVMGARPALLETKNFVDHIMAVHKSTEMGRMTDAYLDGFRKANGEIDTVKLVFALRMRGAKVVQS